MENNKENKSKFFALYYGQNVLSHKYYNQGEVKDVDEYFTELKNCDDGYFLTLKNLSSIEDSDAVSIGFTSANSFVKFMNAFGDDFCEMVLQQNDIDYLRSKHFALPFMSLSVENLISYEWIKIINN